MWTGDPCGVWARHPVKHSTPETWRTRCDGCEFLVCIEQQRSRLRPWRYYCEALHRTVEFKELFEIGKQDCPVHRDLRGRWSRK